MNKFIWLDEYKIGDEIIDQQHEYLFDLANQIVDPDNDAQKTHLNVLALYHYFREHFKDEETLMKQYHYPDYAEHVKNHEELSKKLSEINDGIVTGETSLDEVAEFMQNWVHGHILEEDLILGKFLHRIKSEKTLTE